MKLFQYDDIKAEMCPLSLGLGLPCCVLKRVDNVPTFTTRCQLFVQPAGCLEGQYGPSSTCVTWKEQVHRSSEVHSVLQCPATDSSLLPLMVSTLAMPDLLQYIANQGEEDWDPAYVIHLHPVATLRNLLPYTVRYMMEVQQPPHKEPQTCHLKGLQYLAVRLLPVGLK